MIRRGLVALLCGWLLLLPLQTQAQVRAWLDRDRIAYGETTTLNVETPDPAWRPDYAPLSASFDVLEQTSRQSFELRNGRSSTRMLFAVALRPRGPGVMSVPALQVGPHRTDPLRLQVTPAQVQPRGAGADAFIETLVDDDSPYVQQAVGVLVRLHYAVPLLSGQLDQEAVDGASLQRIGEDAQYAREIGGRRYNVVERRYLLVPERSGELVLPGARFNGQGMGSFIDDLFGDGRVALTAGAPVQRLRVQPIPDGAPQPWLPLRDLKLRYLSRPTQARAGEAVTLEIEAIADGATAAQLPALAFPPDARVQVFADPPQADEQFVDGRPRTVLRQRMAVVPLQAGALELGGPSLAWFDAQQGVARVEQLPALALQVAPGSGGFVRDDADPAQDAADVDGTQRAPMHIAPWMWAAAAMTGVLLAMLLAWSARRRTRQPVAQAAGAGRTSVPAVSAVGLRQALAAGALAQIAQALSRESGAQMEDLARVRARLDDITQVEAVDALQAARWGGGDAASALALLRRAFADGPRWRQASSRNAADVLPPLYPQG